jgi:hypothetical protein
VSFEEIQAAIEALLPEQRHALEAWLRQRADADRVTGDTAKSKGKRTLRNAVVWSALTLFAFFIVEASIFRLGWYNKYLEPNSSTAEIEYALFWLSRAPVPKIPEVLVIGDSRIGEGFSARIAKAETGGRLGFRNFGLAGSSPRVWFYVLRDADPHRNRFRAITIALGHYSDEDWLVPQADNLIDLRLAIGRLRVTDCWEFSRSFQNSDLRHKALAGCLLRGITLRNDLIAFLTGFKDRLTRARDWRDHGAGYIDGYEGKQETLAGLSVDWNTRTIHFPPGVKEGQIGSVKSAVTPEKAPETGELTRYRRQWLGKILDLYKGSSTQIIFMELPRAPIPVPDGPTPARFIQWAEGEPHVTVIPSSTFRDLEHPEMFADGLHLNHLGRPLFSKRLARSVESVLEGS